MRGGVAAVAVNDATASTSTAAVSSALSSGYRVDLLRRGRLRRNTRGVAHTTSHAPDGAGPSPENQPGQAGKAAGTGRVQFSLVRWVLAPRTTLQARRLVAE